jgi:glutaredoxin
MYTIFSVFLLFVAINKCIACDDMIDDLPYPLHIDHVPTFTEGDDIDDDCGMRESFSDQQLPEQWMLMEIMGENMDAMSSFSENQEANNVDTEEIILSDRKTPVKRKTRENDEVEEAMPIAKRAALRTKELKKDIEGLKTTIDFDFSTRKIEDFSKAEREAYVAQLKGKRTLKK